MTLKPLLSNNLWITMILNKQAFPKNSMNKILKSDFAHLANLVMWLQWKVVSVNSMIKRYCLSDSLNLKINSKITASTMCMLFSTSKLLSPGMSSLRTLHLSCRIYLNRANTWITKLKITLSLSSKLKILNSSQITY